MSTASAFSGIGRTALEAATSVTRVSMDSAERAVNVQLQYARGALEQAAINARAVSRAKDVQELLALRSRMAENAVENLVGYSRSLYEVASEAQSEYSRIAEERLTRLQQAVTETVDEAARTAPAGGDLAAAAVKSQLAAATAAFDSFAKAARHVASFTDAGVRAGRNGKTRK